MINVKSLNETIINIINNIHDVLPEADIKEGTFLRDVIINPVAYEFSNVYDNLYQMELAQSILTATGEDLDRLGSNYFIQRKSGTQSSGKVRFYVADTRKDAIDKKYPDIRIPKGTIVGTYGTIDEPSIKFQTLDEVLISGTTKSSKNGDVIITTGVLGLPRDHTGYRYIEVACQSIDIGTKTNIGPYSIVSQLTSTIDSIYSVSNPYSFSGGSDAEDDISLALRIGLAITGSNIGTKDGYLSYVLQQPQVLDAIVVGAGDPYMKRDYLKIVSDNGEIVEGNMGGKVDIYVRTNTTSQDEFQYRILADDLDNEYEVPRKLVFPSKAYPVEKIVSIVGKRVNIDNEVTYVTYTNANDYECELLSTNDEGNYYIDILWDFSIKNFFPDNLYYPLPSNLSENEIIRLKTKLDNELLIALQYLENISYKIQWDKIEWVSGNEDPNETNSTTLFDYGEYKSNGLNYKIKMKSSSYDSNMLGGRIFVKKENKIYVRAYVTPDFKLIKDDGNFMGSIYSQDYIQWFPKNSGINNIQIPQVNEDLTIKYINNSGIRELQEGMEIKRVLTADVLIKSAKRKDIEISLHAICSPSYDPDEMRTTISNALSYHVNNNKKLGGYLDESDIVYIVKGIDGILSVDIDLVKLNLVNEPEQDMIKCEPDEYFFLKNLILNISNKGIV